MIVYRVAFIDTEVISTDLHRRGDSFYLTEVPFGRTLIFKRFQWDALDDYGCKAEELI